MGLEKDKFVFNADFVGSDFDISTATTTNVLTILKAKFHGISRIRIGVHFTELLIKATVAIKCELQVLDATLLIASLEIGSVGLETVLDAEGTADTYMGDRSFEFDIDPALLGTNIKLDLVTTGSGPIAKGFAYIVEAKGNA